MAVITIAGEQLIAQKQQAEEPLEIAEFVLAYVPGVDPSVPPERNQSLPPSNQIRLRMAPTRSAYVNSNEVVYSLILDNTVGNFDFNWLGLVSEEGILVSANHMVVQSKRKNNELSGEEGNNLTRNFLMKFSGAQAITNLTIPAETWQFNYTEKLNEMDQLLVSLATGFLFTQKSLVELNHQNMGLNEFNRELLARVSLLETQTVIRRDQSELTYTEVQNNNELFCDARKTDAKLFTSMFLTQKHLIQNDHDNMMLDDRIKKLEK